jgi:Ca2+:H+ antiporter
LLLTGKGWPYLLVPLVPVAIVLELVHADPCCFLRPRFVSSRLPHPWAAPPRGLRLTRVRHRRLLNVRFRSVPELIIALFRWCRVHES